MVKPYTGNVDSVEVNWSARPCVAMSHDGGVRQPDNSNYRKAVNLKISVPLHNAG